MALYPSFYYNFITPFKKAIKITDCFYWKIFALFPDGQVCHNDIELSIQ